MDLPLQGVIFWRLRMYRGLWRYASLPDLRRMLVAIGLGAMAIALVVALFRLAYVPRSVLILYPILLAVFMGGSRVTYRAWKEGHLTRLSDAKAKHVVILGAGSAAADLLKGLGRNPDWQFIGLLDDNPALLRREIHGLRVLGPLDALAGRLPPTAGWISQSLRCRVRLTGYAAARSSCAPRQASRR